MKLTFKSRPCLASLSIVLFGTAAVAQIAPETVHNLNVTAVKTFDDGTPGLGIYVSQAVINGCPGSNYYVIRDTAITTTALSLATTALISGAPINVYVSGACDTTTKQPLINSVALLSSQPAS